jgi:hypothetical protein
VDLCIGVDCTSDGKPRRGNGHTLQGQPRIRLSVHILNLFGVQLAARCRCDVILFAAGRRTFTSILAARIPEKLGCLFGTRLASHCSWRRPSRHARRPALSSRLVEGLWARIIVLPTELPPCCFKLFLPLLDAHGERSEAALPIILH